jgi:hypothetical protein
MGRNSDKADWARNRLGPFTVLRRYAGGTVADGRLYTATRSENAPPGLVVVPASPGHFLPRGEWQLRASASTTPGYLALELERAPGCRAPLSEVAEGLDVLANALESLERDPEAAAHLLGALGIRRRPAPSARQWRPAAWAVGAAAALALLLWPRAVERASGVTRAASVRGDAQTALADEAVRTPVMGITRVSREAVALDMPKKPFEGQHRAPCEEGEVELRTKDGTKACWFKMDFSRDTCARRGYEHEGKCYLPSMAAQRRPAADKP